MTTQPAGPQGQMAGTEQMLFRATEVRYFKAEDCLREALRADLGMSPGLDLEAMIEELASDDQRDPAPEITEPAGS
jgi:hypothetical protein